MSKQSSGVVGEWSHKPLIKPHWNALKIHEEEEIDENDLNSPRHTS